MKAGSSPRAPRYWFWVLLGWLRNSPPAPLTRSVAATSVPFSFEIICWIGPPGAACTMKKLTTMIANRVGSISAMRRIAYAIIAGAASLSWTRPHPQQPQPARGGGAPGGGGGGGGGARRRCKQRHLATSPFFDSIVCSAFGSTHQPSMPTPYLGEISGRRNLSQ